jgi:type IV secretion system protein VirB8
MLKEKPTPVAQAANPASGQEQGTAWHEQAAAWYLDQAMKHERDRTADAKRHTKIAWRVAGAAMAVTVVTIVTSGIVVQNNKPNPPAVLQVAETGDVRMLKTLSDAKITYGQATDLFNLRRYVELRESYDWETIQDTFDATLAMSSPREAAIYRTQNDEHNQAAPVNVLRDKYRVIAKAGTVSWIGKTALVSFSKRVISLTSDKAPPTKYYVATIAYGYDNVPMDDKARGYNAAGFKATSYNVASDITKDMATAKGAEAGQ